MAGAAIAAAQQLVRAVTYVAESICTAMEEAETILNDLPLVVAGIEIVRDAIGKQPEQM